MPTVQVPRVWSVLACLLRIQRLRCLCLLVSLRASYVGLSGVTVLGGTSIDGAAKPGGKRVVVRLVAFKVSAQCLPVPSLRFPSVCVSACLCVCGPVYLFVCMCVAVYVCGCSRCVNLTG